MFRMRPGRELIVKILEYFHMEAIKGKKIQERALQPASLACDASMETLLS